MRIWALKTMFPTHEKYPFSVSETHFSLKLYDVSFVILCNVLELVDNFGFLISFFFDKFIC